MADAVVLPEYNKLLHDCKGIFIKANKALVTAIWEVGKRINEALGEGRAQYGAETVTRLAQDLRMEKRNLERARIFARKFRKGDIAPNLGWTHYQPLLPLPKQKAVDLAQKFDEKGLTVKDIKKEVAKVKERKFKGEPGRKADVAVDKMFNRLFAIPPAEDVSSLHESREIEQKYYDRLVTKVKMAEERVRGLKKFVDGMKPIPDKTEKKPKKKGEEKKKSAKAKKTGKKK
ncbi:MAG: hypothetical protein KAT43_06215 [Nanoarchaeota archaeon]|nr:hypothetical protein [Nanoarchaeota archaeon]